MAQDILRKIIHNPEIEMPLSAHYLDKLNFYEKEQGKWYLRSFDSEGKEKLVYNEHTGKSAPEEVVRQLFLYELINKYGYPKDRIKIEQSVTFGRDEKKRADVIVYQNYNSTPWIVAEIKAPNQKNNIQQLRSYLNAEGSPIGVGFNGKNISRFIRPYPKEFETLTDLPYEHEYQTAKGADNLIQKIKELIANRTWTLPELNKLNEEKQFDLRAIIEELEELVLANSGVESFNEIFKLIYAKLYDEFEAVNRDNETLFFRDYGNAQITYKKISELFTEAKTEWKQVFEDNDIIKLTPEHLEICIGKLTEVKLYGANLRIIDEAFEYLVSEVSKGKKGQYFTPRVVIDACVQILNPKRREYVLDPACGSAGFLVHTMQYVWDKYQMKDYRTQSGYAFKYLWGIDFDERAAKISRAVMLIGGDGRTHIYKQNSLEYDKWDETLKGDLKEEGMLKTDNPKNLEFDIIMSNPPFAGEIKEKAIINLYHDLLGLRYTFNMEASNIKAILKSLASEFNVEFEEDSEAQIKDKVKEINKNGDINLENEEDITNALNEICDLLIDLVVSGELRKNLLLPRLREMVKYKKTQTKWEKVDRHILFIQRILDMLKEGGRCVIVLPQGIFNNSSEKYLRRFLFDKARILGVIGLHSNSFKPHTGTKTSLLFLHKYTQAELAQQKNKSDYPIFFATSKLSFKDNSGRYVFATDQDGNAIVDKYKNQMYFTDLFDVVEAFKEFGLEELKNGNNAFSFLEGEPKAKNIPYSKITANEVANYNLRLDAEYWDLEVLKVIEKIKSTDYAPLHKFTTISGGFAWKSEFFGEKGEGLPFVRIRDCKPTYIDNENLTTLAPEYVKNLDIPQAQKGDIVVGMDGLKYFYGSLIVEPVYVNQRVCHLKVLENSELEPEYIVFIINSKIGQTQLLRQMTIADTVGHITNVDVHNLLIPLFDKETRAKITESVKKSIEAEINAKKLIKLAKQAVEIYVEQDEQSALQYIEKGLETV